MAPAAGYQQATAEVELEDFEDVTLLAAPMDVEKAPQQQHESMGSRLWRWLPAWLGNGRSTHGFEQLRASETGDDPDVKPGKQHQAALSSGFRDGPWRLHCILGLHLATAPG